MNDTTSDNTKLDLLEQFGIVYRNRKIVIIITLLHIFGVLTFSVASILMDPQKSFYPNEFTANSYVLLNSSESSGGFESLLNSSGMGAIAGLAGISSTGTTVSDSDLAIVLTKTNAFINELDRNFNLSQIYETFSEKYPKTSLKKNIAKRLTVSIDDKTSLLKISYTDINKQLATEIVNKVTDLLEKEFEKIDKIRNSNQFVLVEDKKTVVENEIEILKQEIIKFQLKHNILDVSIVSEEIVKLISTLQTSLLEKEVEIESYGNVTNIKDPIYLKLLNERDAIKKAIKKVEKGEVGDYPAVEQIPILAFELEELKRKLEIQMIGYKALVQQSETLKLTAEGTGSTFQILESAEVPEKKSGPSRAKLCLIVTIFGFFISITYIFVREEWIKIKNDPDKVAKLKGNLQ